MKHPLGWIGGALALYAWLICTALSIPLPSSDSPLLFYSSQTRQDIKHTFFKAIENAQTSVFISMYGVTDTEILTLLQRKSQEGLDICVEFDPTASTHLHRFLPHTQLRPIKTTGLMHKKVIVIDHNQIFLGSANLTLASLRHHHNLVIGCYNPLLAAFLETPSSPTHPFSIGDQKGELFLCPDQKKQGLTRLLQLLTGAKKTIRVAMFTLTHPKIVATLIEAQQRGVDVRVAIDHFTAKGASRKAIEHLQCNGIKIFLSQGQELLHYKWAWIDESLLVMGSSNWTQAAFVKNHDFLLFLSSLERQHHRFLNRLWDIIAAESRPVI